MNARTAAILLLAIPAAPPAVHDAQVAALRAAVSNRAIVCVAVNAGTLRPPVTKGSHLESTKTRQDPPAAMLDVLRRSSSAFAPASQCTRTEREWDIVDRISGKAALLAVVGQVEVLTRTHVRVTVLTTSGFLSDTHTLFDVEMVDGVWKVSSSTIILQA